MDLPICVVLARPMNAADPCLMQAGGGNALVRVLRKLQQQGLFSEILFSVPDSTPKHLVELLRKEGIPVVVSIHEQPQRRLLESMQKEQADVAAVLSSYSLLLDMDSLKRSLRAVQRGEADAVFTQDVIAPKHFMILTKNMATALADEVPRPIPPFVFADKMALLNADNIRKPVACEGIESPDERFLWELLFAGEPCAIPQAVYTRFLSHTADGERLDKASFRRFILQEYGLNNSTFLTRELTRMEPWDSSLRLAMHINYARSLADYFPLHRGTALEIGHGRTGITAQLIGMAFDRTMGVDLFKHSQKGIDAARAFLNALAKSNSTLLPIRGNVNSSPKFLNCRLEEAQLDADSIDFCFSRMVLEHVDNVPEMSAEMERVMRPGGVMVHEIGLQDHEDLSHIHFEFLKNSPEEWAAMKKGTNLLRVNDFVDIWTTLGFTCEVVKRDVREVPPRSLHPHWEPYCKEDLYCYRALIKATKREAP